jgi:hypothetical protein
MKKLFFGVFVLQICSTSFAMDCTWYTKRDKTIAVRDLSEYKLARDISNSNDTQAMVSLVTEGRVIFLPKDTVLNIVGEATKYDGWEWFEIRKTGSTNTYYVRVGVGEVYHDCKEVE